MNITCDLTPVARPGLTQAPGHCSVRLLSSLISPPLSLPNRHWLSSAYTQFAVPYFIYDIYAMFLCHWHKHQVKGHGGDEGGPRAPGSTWAVARGYLHKEFLMVLHHAVMVLVCFPLSVVSRGAESQGSLSCSHQCYRSPGNPVARSPSGRAVPGRRGFPEHQASPKHGEGLESPGPGLDMPSRGAWELLLQASWPWFPCL